MTQSDDNQPELEIGDVMPDGTLYAGISPDTDEALYVTPQDAPLTMTWKKATEYADALDAHNHSDWRLPTEAELKLFFENRHKGALKGTFNEKYGSGYAHWYWSCTENCGDPSVVYGVPFTSGGDGWSSELYAEMSTRPVRTEPRPGA